MSAGDGAADLRSDWPFVAGKAKGTGADADEFEGKVTGAKWFGGRLESDASIFKYTITTTPSGGGTPIVFDPQIIIDN